MNIDYANLIQNSDIFKSLLNDIRADNIAHAYMLCGEDIIAVTGAARLFAEKLAKKSDIVCVPFDGDAEKVKTEDINTLTEDCYLKPYDSDRKIYVIKNAHTMTEQAQNKLLKTLEEPPAGVIIILCAAVPARLLNTIHSRCRKFTVPPFAPQALQQFLVNAGVQAEQADLASVYGGGSITAAERILSDTHCGAALALILDMFRGMKKSPDILSFAAKLGGYKDMAQELLDFMLIAARDIMTAGTNNAELIFTKRRKDDIISLSSGIKGAACALIIDKIAYAKKRLHYNCNFQGVIDELLFGITEIINKV